MVNESLELTKHIASRPAAVAPSRTFVKAPPLLSQASSNPHLAAVPARIFSWGQSPYDSFDSLHQKWRPAAPSAHPRCARARGARLAPGSAAFGFRVTHDAMSQASQADAPPPVSRALCSQEAPPATCTLRAGHNSHTRIRRIAWTELRAQIYHTAELPGWGADASSAHDMDLLTSR